MEQSLYFSNEYIGYNNDDGDARDFMTRRCLKLALNLRGALTVHILPLISFELSFVIGEKGKMARSQT